MALPTVHSGDWWIKLGIIVIFHGIFSKKYILFENELEVEYQSIRQRGIYKDAIFEKIAAQLLFCFNLFVLKLSAETVISS